MPLDVIPRNFDRFLLNFYLEIYWRKMRRLWSRCSKWICKFRYAIETFNFAHASSITQADFSSFIGISILKYVQEIYNSINPSIKPREMKSIFIAPFRMFTILNLPMPNVAIRQMRLSLSFPRLERNFTRCLQQ